MKKRLARGGSNGSELLKMGKLKEKVDLPCLHRSKEDKYYLLKAGMKYFCYWFTIWLVLKIFVKLTSYSLLMSSGRVEEATTCIHDWGPLVNTFIYYVFIPVSKITMFFYNHVKPFSDDLYRTFLFPLYHCHVKHLLEPALLILRDISIKLLLLNTSVYKTFFFHLGTLSFIFIFCYACGDIIWIYQKNKMKKESVSKKKGVLVGCGHDDCLWTHLNRF